TSCRVTEPPPFQEAIPLPLKEVSRVPSWAAALPARPASAATATRVTVASRRGGRGGLMPPRTTAAARACQGPWDLAPPGRHRVIAERAPPEADERRQQAGEDVAAGGAIEPAALDEQLAAEKGERHPRHVHHAGGDAPRGVLDRLDLEAVLLEAAREGAQL